MRIINRSFLYWKKKSRGVPLWAIVSCLLLAAFFGGCAGKEAVQSKKQPLPAVPEISEYKSDRLLEAGGMAKMRHSASPAISPPYVPADFNTESYDRVNENSFKEVLKNPLSTFSVDVDTASYANVRRFLTNGAKPPADAVRIEEMINYFTYDYPQPTGKAPFSFTTELTDAPWNPANKLLLIGLQGKKIPTHKAPPANLVFLIDVSGSMNQPNKLPLLVKSFKLLTGQLRARDRVAIVVYAGSAGVVLPSTSGTDKEKILAALEGLRAGGSTAGGQGIELAYRIAMENFIRNGNNRVILATDGDFNVGASSDAAMERLIEEKRRSGVFLSVLGFGMGNYKDSKMQKLADRGNGNYAYIDSLLEAKKVLISQFGGTLFTIAKDVKLQVEFNPAKVASYRLIGYEKRLLLAEDFANDKKDAGEIGSGHTVTALYEIVPVHDATTTQRDLVYQTVTVKDSARKRKELATIRFRYKKPNEDRSTEIVRTIPPRALSLEKAGSNILFAAAVTEWGMLLRNSEHKGTASYEQVLATARKARGNDAEGYRAEFIRLVEMSRLLDSNPRQVSESSGRDTTPALSYR